MLARHFSRILAIATLAAVSVGAVAQKWISPYEKGLSLAKKGLWAEAREQFLEAIKHRPLDTDQPSQVGSSVVDRQPWREGAPYTPNFDAAYCAFKLAASAQDEATRKAWLKESIEGFKRLIDGGQVSVEALVFLAASYAVDGQNDAAAATQERLSKLDVAKAFRVDTEVLEYDDARVIANAKQRGETPDPGGLSLPDAGNPFGVVPVLPFKYALLIGNRAGGQGFATADVDLVKAALIKDAGYGADNIVGLKDPSSEEALAAAKSLAERMPDGGTLLIFFSGPARYDVATGQDLLGGFSGGTQFIPKMQIFETFIPKGTSIFAFYQVDRTIGAGGKYFGLQVPQFGKIAQSFGTAPGELANSTVYEGRVHGTYAAAFCHVLSIMRNNRIPINEFAWMVFDTARKGTAQGGGGGQTPTLPVYVGLGSSAKF